VKALWKLGNILSQGATTLSAFRKINIPNTLRRINNFIIVTGMATIMDLQQLFGSDERILREPQHQFDGLPIHCIVYCLVLQIHKLYGSCSINLMVYLSTN